MKLYIEKSIEVNMPNGDQHSTQYNAEVEGDAEDIAKILHMLGLHEHIKVNVEAA